MQRLAELSALAAPDPLQAVSGLLAANGWADLATLAANGFFRLRYDGVLDTWNRCG